MSRNAVRLLTLGLALGLAALTALELEVATSIEHFVPRELASGDPEVAEVSRRLMESELSRAMVLRLEGGSDPHAAARALAEALAAEPDVATVRAVGDGDADEALFALFFERRVYLASADPETEIPALFGAAALEERARALRLRLSGPVSPLLTRTAPADPLGLSGAFLENLARLRPTTGDAAHVLLRTRASAFDAEAQARVLAAVDGAFAQAAEAFGPGLTLAEGGMNRFAVASERAIRRDVRFISVVSVVGVSLLYLLVFRSFASLWTALLAPALGIACAAALGAQVFSPVHAVTLGFGLALVGVAIDYPIHLINHHGLGPPGTAPAATLARIRGSILLGGATTASAFAVLALSDFPGVDQMGVFAAVGIGGALLATLFCVPAFLPPEGRATGLQRALADGLARAVKGLMARRAGAVAILAAVAALAALGLPRVAWEDDPASLSAPDPALLAEDRRARAGLAQVDPDRFVVALGDDREAALRTNDAVHARLVAAVAEGALGGMRSLHAVLRSEELQRRNLAAFRSVPNLAERIDAAFTRAGFRPGAFDAFARAVAEPDAEPLRPEDLAGTSLAGLLDAGLVQVEPGGRWAAITYLSGVRSPEAVRAALAGVEGAHYFDRDHALTEAFAAYRRTTLRLVAVGALVVFTILFVRYRTLHQALRAFGPSVLVVTATLGVYGLAGHPVNLLEVISVVLVMGMGVDYGVFMVDAGGEPERLAPTLAGLLVSCLTTLFVFGTLALSEHPPLRSIGLTTGIGILLAFAVAPAAAALGPGRRAGRA